MKPKVFDLHCDTALALLGKDLSQISPLRQNGLHIDLNRADALGGYAQCFALFTTPFMEQWYGKSPVHIFELEMAAILSEIEKNPDRIALAYSPEDVEKNDAKGLYSAILTVEGAAGFGYDPELLEDLYKIGIRISTLGWNEHNCLCGSHKTGEGLSDLGKVYVRTAQQLGILIDVSHISDQAFWDIMDITQAPVIASHSNSRSICNVSRNLTDDMFLKICQCDGVVGLNLFSDFVGEMADLNKAADHLLHFMELDPDGKHISLGGDMDGCDTLVAGIDGLQDYPKLAEILLQRGLNEQNISDLFWNNALGVMRRAVHHK